MCKSWLIFSAAAGGAGRQHKNKSSSRGRKREGQRGAKREWERVSAACRMYSICTWTSFELDRARLDPMVPIVRGCQCGQLSRRRSRSRSAWLLLQCRFNKLGTWSQEERAKTCPTTSTLTICRRGKQEKLARDTKHSHSRNQNPLQVQHYCMCVWQYVCEWVCGSMCVSVSTHAWLLSLLLRANFGHLPPALRVLLLAISASPAPLSPQPPPVPLGSCSPFFWFFSSFFVLVLGQCRSRTL